MFRRLLFLVPFILFGHLASADELPAREPTRGELLYTTHCVACHNTQVHWRDKEIAKNWSGLKAEVSHWQTFSELGWSDGDIEAVARYLNALYYHFDAPPQP